MVSVGLDCFSFVFFFYMFGSRFCVKTCIDRMEVITCDKKKIHINFWFSASISFDICNAMIFCFVFRLCLCGCVKHWLQKFSYHIHRLRFNLFDLFAFDLCVCFQLSLSVVSYKNRYLHLFDIIYFDSYYIKIVSFHFFPHLLLFILPLVFLFSFFKSMNMFLYHTYKL